MKIAVFGGGSVGLAYASLLSKISPDVMLFVRRSGQEKAINRNGITLITSKGKSIARVKATTDLTDLSKIDVLITLVKNYDSQNAAKIIATHTKKSCIIVTTESGIGVEEVYNKICIPRKIIRAVSYFGANRITNTETELADNMNISVQKPDSEDKIISELLSKMQKAGFVVEVSDTIQEVVWKKMITVIAQHALSALTGMTFGQLLESIDALYLAEKLLKEFRAIAQKEKIYLPEDMMEIVKNNWKSLPDHKSSMYQDIAAGRKTEIDMMNGAIVRLGEKHHIPTPYNDMVTRLIQIKQQTNQF